MQTNGVLAEISDVAFFEALGGLSYNEVIKSMEIGKIKKISEYDNLIKTKLLNLKAKNLIVQHNIAKGQFGDLYLVNDQY